MCKQTIITFLREMHYQNKNWKYKIINCTIKKSISMNYQNENLKDKIINCTNQKSIPDFSIMLIVPSNEI